MLKCQAILNTVCKNCVCETNIAFPSQHFYTTQPAFTSSHPLRIVNISHSGDMFKLTAKEQLSERTRYLHNGICYGIQTVICILMKLPNYSYNWCALGINAMLIMIKETNWCKFGSMPLRHSMNPCNPLLITLGDRCNVWRISLRKENGNKEYDTYKLMELVFQSRGEDYILNIP